jgi:hypothetical protein
MSIKEAITKTSIANICAAVGYVGGLGYAFYTSNAEMMFMLIGAAIGYLYGKKSD